MTSSIQSALVFGATSAIATAYCRILASRGASLYLVGRDAGALKRLADDLVVRGAKSVSLAVADLSKVDEHEQLVADGWQQLHRPDLVLLAHGQLGKQSEQETSWQLQNALVQINLASHMSLLSLLANRFEQQGSGCLAAISSVAGDRGRSSNYIYASTKAGLSCYLQGLQQRLASAGVRVIDLRLGPVDTPMTAGMHKGIMFSTPERIARAMDRGIARRSGTLYLPFFWRPVMMVVRSMPAILIQKIGI